MTQKITLFSQEVEDFVIEIKIDADATFYDLHKLIQNLLLIEERLCVKYVKTDISEIDEEIAKMITIIVASINGKQLLEHLPSDTIRSSYNGINDNIIKDISLKSVLVCKIEQVYFNLLGIDIVIKGYTMTFINARINNLPSIRKGVKMKRKNILVSLKPKKGNKSIEKYTIIEEFYACHESLQKGESPQ